MPLAQQRLATTLSLFQRKGGGELVMEMEDLAMNEVWGRKVEEEGGEERRKEEETLSFYVGWEAGFDSFTSTTKVPSTPRS